MDLFPSTVLLHLLTTSICADGGDMLKGSKADVEGVNKDEAHTLQPSLYVKCLPHFLVESRDRISSSHMIRTKRPISSPPISL